MLKDIPDTVRAILLPELIYGECSLCYTKGYMQKVNSYTIEEGFNDECEDCFYLDWYMETHETNRGIPYHIIKVKNICSECLSDLNNTLLDTLEDNK